MKPKTISNLMFGLGVCMLIVAMAFYMQDRIAGNNNSLSLASITSPVAVDAVTPTNGVFTTELVYFNAVSLGEETVLSWDAANELELVGYQVERAGDSLNFNRIGWVYCREISRELFYEFVDEDVIPGYPYFYRLKMVEFDGAMEYSPAVKAVQLLQ